MIKGVLRASGIMVSEGRVRLAMMQADPNAQSRRQEDISSRFQPIF